MDKEPAASPNDHLANERTFLAWIRTSIAVTGFGFIIVKSGIYLNQLAAVAGRPPVAGAESQIPGMALIIAGMVLTLLGYSRYRKVYQALSSASYRQPRGLPLLLAAVVVLCSAGLLLHLLLHTAF